MNDDLLKKANALKAKIDFYEGSIEALEGSGTMEIKGKSYRTLNASFESGHDSKCKTARSSFTYDNQEDKIFSDAFVVFRQSIISGYKKSLSEVRKEYEELE